MALSIKSVAGMINEPPIFSNLNVTKKTTNTISLEWTLTDLDLTICRQYLILNGQKKEISKEIGYEKVDNKFTYTISGLAQGTIYQIKLEATDGHDIAMSDLLNVQTERKYIYGVKVNESNSNPETSVTYIEDAIGITPATPTSLGGWADKWPFNEIKIVGFKAGKVTKEINPFNKTHYKDGEAVPHDVDVMVKFPKIYWKFTSTSDGFEVRISNQKVDSTWDCYAHKVNGNERDFIYIGAYEGYVENSKLRSISGVTPTGNLSLNNARKYAQNVGQGYKLNPFLRLQLRQILFVINYKNLNSQLALGKGAVNTTLTNTGGTNTKGLNFGTQDAKIQVSFLGIEDVYGNLKEYVDGIWIRINTGKHHVQFNNANFNSTGNGYTDTQIYGFYDNGYINKTVCNNKIGFIPQTVKGSATTYYSDFSQYTAMGEDRPPTHGESFNSEQMAGIFSLNFREAGAGGNVEDVGARLCYLG